MTRRHRVSRRRRLPHKTGEHTSLWPFTLSYVQWFNWEEQGRGSVARNNLHLHPWNGAHLWSRSMTRRRRASRRRHLHQSHQTRVKGHHAHLRFRRSHARLRYPRLYNRLIIIIIIITVYKRTMIFNWEEQGRRSISQNNLHLHPWNGAHLWRRSMTRRRRASRRRRLQDETGEHTSIWHDTNIIREYVQRQVTQVSLSETDLVRLIESLMSNMSRLCSTGILERIYYNSIPFKFLYMNIYIYIYIYINIKFCMYLRLLVCVYVVSHHNRARQSQHIYNHHSMLLTSLYTLDFNQY